MMLALVLPAVLVLWVMGRAYTEVDEAFVDEWSRAHALRLTTQNRTMVHWYLRTARILRAWGVVAGLLLPSVIAAAFGLSALADAQLPGAFLGYLLGALYAEVALVRPASGTTRQAVLVPREIDDYLPRRLLVAQRALGAVALVGAGLTFTVDYQRFTVDGFRGSPRATAVTAATVCVVLALALERLQRWVVHRPQPFTDAELVAADDAIRSQSVHSLAGSGLAMQLLALGLIASALWFSDAPVFRWTMWLPAAACFLGSIHVCLYYGHRAWRVRRAVPRPASA
jgi:hypothetical protein